VISTTLPLSPKSTETKGEGTSFDWQCMIVAEKEEEVDFIPTDFPRLTSAFTFWIASPNCEAFLQVVLYTCGAIRRLGEVVTVGGYTLSTSLHNP